MKKSRAALAGTLSLSLLLTMFGGIGASAAKDADAYLNAPTTAQWAVKEGDTISHVTSAAEGGIHVSFDQTSNQTSIASKNKYKWDGLHIRLENIKQPEGAALYLSSASQHAIHYPPGPELQINIITGVESQVSVYGNAWGNNPHPFGVRPDGFDTDTVDIRLSKNEYGDMVLNINGHTDSYTCIKDTLDSAGIEDEVYIGFLNCFTETKQYSYDVTVLHDGSTECKAGEEVTTENYDPALYAPTAELALDNTAQDKFTITGIEGGGLHFEAAGTKTDDRVTIDKQYAFDGLHFVVENIESTRNVFTFQFGQEKNKSYSAVGAPADNHSYSVSVYLESGMVKHWSHFLSAQDTGIAASDKIAGSTSLDVKLFIAANGDYKCSVNGEEWTLITKANYDQWAPQYGLDLSKVYLAVEGGDIDGQTEARDYSFDLISLHGGDEACYGEVASILIEAVEELETALDALPSADKITLEDEAEITALRAKYDALNTLQLALFDESKLAALTAAEEKLAVLKEEQEEQGAEQVQKVIELIKAIGTPITLDSERAIVAAEEAYAALTDAQKEQVTNYIDLALARVSLNGLKEGGTAPDPSDPDDGNVKDPADTGVTAYPAFAALLLLAAGAAAAAGRKRKAL